MPKRELEFTNSDFLGEWRPIEGALEGMWQKILSFDPDNGDMTRLVRFEPGLETHETLAHDFWEEVYILEGSMTDTGKNLTMGRGYYACRPEGMLHGPYSVPTGCTMLEIRYR